MNDMQPEQLLRNMQIEGFYLQYSIMMAPDTFRTLFQRYHI